MQRPKTDQILIAWPSLPRTTAGRILQRQRATLRRMRKRDLAVSSAALEAALDRLLAQWVDAAATRRDVVDLRLELSTDEAHDWLAGARDLLLTMTNEHMMQSLGGPVLDPSDASVLRDMIDHVARVTEPG